MKGIWNKLSRKSSSSKEQEEDEINDSKVDEDEKMGEKDVFNHKTEVLVK